MPLHRLPHAPLLYYQVAGADAADWLQGQLTQNVCSVNSSALTAVLTPTGQIIADGAVHKAEDGWIIGFDREAAEDAVNALHGRIVMEDVELSPLPPATVILGSHPDGLSTAHACGGTTDYLGEAPAAEPISPEEYEHLRIRTGIPLKGREYDSKTLAMEMGEHFVATRIAFGKGCYTGQEIVERVRSRGKTHRTLVGLLGRCDGLPDSVRVTSISGDYALAYVPWDLATPGNRVGTALVCSLPFNEKGAETT